MAKSSTSFGKDKQPEKRRGKAQRTKILEAMEREGVTEEGFYELLVQRAFNPEDNFAFKELLGRLYPVPKQTLPTVEFKFDAKAKPAEQATQILQAASEGIIAPDIAEKFINSVAAMLKIDEITQLRDDVEAIKKMMGEQDG